LKSGGYGEDETHRALIGEARNIELITDELTDPEMAALYRSVAIEGAYVHPHRAECVGMPVLQALASDRALADWMLRIAGTPAIPAESEGFATEISARYSYETLVGRLDGWLSTV
jgi:hypothetical protein